VSRLEIKDKGVTNDPCIAKEKISCFDGEGKSKGEYEVRRKVNSKVLDEGQQQVSTRVSNRIIVRQGM